MLKANRPLFVDIDGTLTNAPEKQWGQVDEKRLQVLRDLIEDGQEVVLWSGGGTRYAETFARKYGLEGVVCVGKPDYMVDDNPTIRPPGLMRTVNPDEFFGDR